MITMHTNYDRYALKNIMLSKPQRKYKVVITIIGGLHF